MIDVLHIALGAATVAACSGWMLYLAADRAVKDITSIAQHNERKLKYCEQCFRDALDSSERQASVIEAMNARFERIAEMETPSANATVQRMAAIARGVEYKHRETPNRIRDGYNSRTGRFVGKGAVQ